jgi:glycosyltransferase involved in cell wall biosynthesis
MSVGLPVITLNLSGARDLIPEAAALKVPLGSTVKETVRNLSAAMDRLAGLPLEERNRMSESAWRRAQDFSWTVRAAFAKELYRSLLDNRRAF